MVAERANGRPLCSVCGRAAPGYDRLPRRSFEFVPLWAFVCFYSTPRGAWRVRTAVSEWKRCRGFAGKRHLTEAYAWFLARWARRLSWKEVARIFHSSWGNVFRAVERAVEWGRVRQDLSSVRAIGIDEIAWKKDHRCLTLVYPIDTHRKRPLWIGHHRKIKALLGFFRWFGNKRSQRLAFACSDRWKPYLKVIAKSGPSRPCAGSFPYHGILLQGHR